MNKRAYTQRRSSPPATAKLRTNLHKALPLRSAAEPDEREDPLNQALDAAEQLVRNIVANGGEAPLRARLARLLPPASAGGAP